MSEDPAVILTNVSGTVIGTQTDPVYTDPLGQSTTNYVPAFDNFTAGTTAGMKFDIAGNLVARSTVFTDEESFRDDFTGASPNILTGTALFTSGSAIVSGSGALFTSEVNVWLYVKESTQSDIMYTRVADVLDDNTIVLTDPYPGATKTGLVDASNWKYNIDALGSISVSGSMMILDSGTSNNAVVEAYREGDYLPIVVGILARSNQRITNQRASFGLGDGNILTAENQAFIVFDGTDPTLIKFVTSNSSFDTEEMTHILPNGGVTSDEHYYQIEVGVDRCSLLIDDVLVAVHRKHIPGPYNTLNNYVCLDNIGIPASPMLFSTDVYFMTNFDQVQIAASVKGDPVITAIAQATLTSGSLISASMLSTNLAQPNSLRKGATIYNDSSAYLYLKLGSSASPTDFTVRMSPASYYEVPYNYIGTIDGYWSAANGAALVTELK